MVMSMVMSFSSLCCSSAMLVCPLFTGSLCGLNSLQKRCLTVSSSVALLSMTNSSHVGVRATHAGRSATPCERVQPQHVS